MAIGYWSPPCLWWAPIALGLLILFSLLDLWRALLFQIEKPMLLSYVGQKGHLFDSSLISAKFFSQNCFWFGSVCVVDIWSVILYLYVPRYILKEKIAGREGHLSDISLLKKLPMMYFQYIRIFCSRMVLIGRYRCYQVNNLHFNNIWFIFWCHSSDQCGLQWPLVCFYCNTSLCYFTILDSCSFHCDVVISEINWV